MEKNYLRMIRVMNARSNQGRREWFVYIARCADDSLYTGIAKDVAARIENHNRGQGSAYARSRRPVALVYCEKRMTRSQALVREAAIKRLSRPQKERLVARGSRPRMEANRKGSGKCQAAARAQRRGQAVASRRSPVAGRGRSGRARRL